FEYRGKPAFPRWPSLCYNMPGRLMTRAEQEKPREMQAPANSYQIILLPNEDYWSWVAGVRDYAVHYRASVTARPEHAVRFHRPQQVITVVDAPGAHNGYANL